MLDIKVKYLDKNLMKLEKIKGGDRIDLRVSKVAVLTSRNKEVYLPTDKPFKFKEGMVIKIHLGIAMQLPEGYEAIISPRSSLFPKHGLLLTNSIGVIDNAYNGDTDEWLGIFYCTKTSQLTYNERILQFRIQEVMPEIKFNEVESLNNIDRGGFGSTGKVEVKKPKKKSVKKVEKAIEPVVEKIIEKKIDTEN